MRRIILAAVCVAALAAGSFPAFAGPLLDDYLNYARMGEKCPGGSSEVTLTTAQPIGQTFTVKPGTGEIYRIGVQANSKPDSWGEGEVVTLTLYDSPSKSRKYGSYTIDWRTCRVQPNRDSDERVLLFPLRAKLSGEHSLYFELTMTGGDGKIRFRSVPSGGYAGGDGYRDGRKETWDLSFETHIKPVEDRIANLKAFWNKFDLNYPPLAAVKAAVQAGDYDKAEEELVKHFVNRSDLYEPKIFEVTPKPDFDRRFADMLIGAKLWQSEHDHLKNIIPWRKQSYWAPDYVKYGKKFDVNIYGWHLERTTWGAYSFTGDEKYARGGMDLRIQWVLDNCPSPKVTGIPAPHEIWNELAAAGRGPGHLPYVFSRVHDYPGFTTDEKMVYIMNWYDNANYLYQSEVGGNWGFQTATACRQFGRDFPEFKKSREFTAWGGERLVDLTMECVRGDGTENEAAIKYHAMCARRLKSLLDDHEKGVATLDANTLPVLKKHLEKMYDYMMYTLQPDNRVVMCGDAWYEDYSDELAEVGQKVNRPDFIWAATKGKKGTPPKEVSKAFPDGGYFIMRSDFGENGKPYSDARQLFVHNGGWVGSHGHYDLLSVNLYAYGQTLLVDPGGMWGNAPKGVDPWWKSSIHSMLVCSGWDCSRDPGCTEWITAPDFDYLDGFHRGYANKGIPKVRRRVVFVKPDYWVVDDSADGKEELQWDQVWNLADGNAKVDNETKVIETTFPSGGNLIILPADETNPEVRTRRGFVPMDGPKDTDIVSYSCRTIIPRFTTVLYPYRDSRPNVQVSHISPDTAESDMITGVRVVNGRNVDFTAWGDVTKGAVTFSRGKHVVDADVLTVRTVSGKGITSLSWARGKRAVFNGRELARADNPVAMLDIAYSPTSVTIKAREPDPTLRVWVGSARTITVNGKKLPNVKPYKGYLRPFPSAEKAIIIDDDSTGFRRITRTTEWEQISSEDAYGLSYTRHETDPGRRESGTYSAYIPTSGNYRLEVFIPKSTTTTPTDAMLYTIQAVAGRTIEPPEAEGPSKAVPNADKGQCAVTVNQQKAAGWIDLGVYHFDQGRHEFLTATNITEIDGLRPIWDAVRLTRDER